MTDEWPEKKMQRCSFCTQEYPVVRKGSGKPWRGRLDYWYTGAHDCPKRAEVDAVSKKMRQAFGILAGGAR